MRRFDVPILVRLADVDPLRLDLVVVHQVAITPAELAIFRKVVHRRTQTVGAVLAGHAAEPPKRLLETPAQRLEGLGETNRNRLPVGIRKREVIQHVVEPLAGDRNAQRVHVREVGGRQAPRIMDLREDHFPAGAMLAAPVANPTLERTLLRVGKTAGVAVLQPAEQRECPQPRLGLQPGLDLRPHLRERVLPRPPGSPRPSLRWQPSRIPILACRLLIHARLPCRRGQVLVPRKQSPQFPYLSVRDHRNLLSIKGLRL